MAINLNQTTPAAPAGTVNGAFQVDVSGNVSVNLPLSAVELSASAVDLTAQTADIVTATLLATTASTRYRISGYLIVTTPGSLSSTLPKLTIGWTDVDNSVAQTIDLTATNSGNLTTTYTLGDAVISALTGSNITYATSGYASNAAGMAYAIHILIEQL